MDILVGGSILIIFFLIIFFVGALIFRGVTLWHFKIYNIVELLESINNKLEAFIPSEKK